MYQPNVPYVMRKGTCLARGRFVVGFSVVVASTGENVCITVEDLLTWSGHSPGICYIYIDATKAIAVTLLLSL